VETPEYLRQLILCIHLNPVTAGIVEKPVDFVWSGHRELVRKVRRPFVDPDQLLLAFDEKRKSARKIYLASIRADTDRPWLDRLPGELPWWPLGRPAKTERDDELRLDPTAPHLDELGRSTARERPVLDAETFVERALDTLGCPAEEMAGRGKRRGVVRAREILMTLGVERYGLRVIEMAAVLAVRYHSACLWSRRGASRRQEDRAFAEKLDHVDSIIASSAPEGTNRLAENV
jgi:hypothetical protein